MSISYGEYKLQTLKLIEFVILISLYLYPKKKSNLYASDTNETAKRSQTLAAKRSENRNVRKKFHFKDTYDSAGQVSHDGDQERDFSTFPTGKKPIVKWNKTHETGGKSPTPRTSGKIKFDGRYWINFCRRTGFRRVDAARLFRRFSGQRVRKFHIWIVLTIFCMPVLFYSTHIDTFSKYSYTKMRFYDF